MSDINNQYNFNGDWANIVLNNMTVSIIFFIKLILKPIIN